MKTTATYLALTALALPIAEAAWDFIPINPVVDGVSDLGSGTDFSFDLLPLQGNYDPGNATDGIGFDFDPYIPTTHTFMSTEPISVQLQASAESANSQFFVDLDPDGNGVIPESIDYSVDFGHFITVRSDGNSTNGGGVGIGVNPGAAQFDLEATLYDGNGDLYAPGALVNQWETENLEFYLTQAIHGFNAPDTINPDGSYSWDDLTADAPGIDFPRAAVTSRAGTRANFPFGTSDLTQVFSFQELSFTDFEPGSTSFLFSVDGGVGVDLAAPPAIPEPSSSLSALFLLSLGLLIRQRR